jgi:GT2 family glycosyltransferase
LIAPRVGLVTVTYNSGTVLEPFLKCVFEQTERSFVLVAVDNASRDQSLPLLQKVTDERIAIIANPDNRGVAEGNNQGIEYCRANGIEWVLLINNDTEFSPTLVEGLLNRAKELNARVVVPRIPYFDRPDLAWYSGGRFSWWRGFQSRHEPPRALAEDQPRITEYAPTCCMLVHKSVFDEIGTMDPAYFVYWDDTDFCWRLMRAGIPIHYDPGLILLHKVSTLTGGETSPFSVRHYSRNQIYFLRKYFSPAVVAANIFWIRFKNRIRLLTGRDDAAIAEIRVQAIVEGQQMKVT